MKKRVLRSTPRGQITLPKKWRHSFNTNMYIVEMNDDSLLVRPLNLEKDSDEEVIFDADLDNNGKGIPMDEMISFLEKNCNE